MNKIISVYELLGLIKDDKAPNSIIYKREYFKYSKENRDYIGENNYLFSDFADLISILNDKVEIIEKDKPIIEKLNLDRESLKGKEVPRAIDYLLEGRINEIIDYITRKENK